MRAVLSDRISAIKGELIYTVTLEGNQLCSTNPPPHERPIYQWLPHSLPQPPGH